MIIDSDDPKCAFADLGPWDLHLLEHPIGANTLPWPVHVESTRGGLRVPNATSVAER